MDPETYIDPNLTEPDLLVLENLLQDVDLAKRSTAKNGVDVKENGVSKARNGNNVKLRCSSCFKITANRPSRSCHWQQLE